MNKILHNSKVFYTLAALLSAIGTYVARLIERQNPIIAYGVLGLVVPYLMYLAFLSRNNVTNRFLELEDLEFPRDIKYLFFGFFWTIPMFWAGKLILNLIRYLLDQ